MNLLLIGYRGTGKTAVAKLLAERLGWRSLDADVELERQARKSIAEIFATQGEAAFRDLESQVLETLLSLDRHVLALGGGVVLREHNRALIQNAGGAVWLTADPETIFERVSADPTTTERRPRLTSQGGIEEIRTLLTAREPFYRQCARTVIETTNRTIDEVAGEIVTKLSGLLP